MLRHSPRVRKRSVARLVMSARRSHRRCRFTIRPWLPRPCAVAVATKDPFASLEAADAAPASAAQGLDLTPEDGDFGSPFGVPLRRVSTLGAWGVPSLVRVSGQIPCGQASQGAENLWEPDFGGNINSLSNVTPR